MIAEIAGLNSWVFVLVVLAIVFLVLSILGRR